MFWFALAYAIEPADRESTKLFFGEKQDKRHVSRVEVRGGSMLSILVKRVDQTAQEETAIPKGSDLQCPVAKISYRRAVTRYT